MAETVASASTSTADESAWQQFSQYPMDCEGPQKATMMMLAPSLKGQEGHIKVGLEYGQSIGDFFFDLDFMRADYLISEITVGVYDGAISGIFTKWTNGITTERGDTTGTGVVKSTLKLNFEKKQRIYAVETETGTDPAKGYGYTRYTMLKFFVHHGDTFTARAANWEEVPKGGSGKRGSKEYTNLRIRLIDGPEGAEWHLNGFSGWCLGPLESASQLPLAGIYRLGTIWSNVTTDFALGWVPRQKTRYYS